MYNRGFVPRAVSVDFENVPELQIRRRRPVRRGADGKGGRLAPSFLLRLLPSYKPSEGFERGRTIPRLLPPLHATPLEGRKGRPSCIRQARPSAAGPSPALPSQAVCVLAMLAQVFAASLFPPSLPSPQDFIFCPPSRRDCCVRRSQEKKRERERIIFRRLTGAGSSSFFPHSLSFLPCSMSFSVYTAG